MQLFNRNKHKKDNTDENPWYGISLYKYTQIFNVMTDPDVADEDKYMLLVQLIYGVNSYNMPYQEFSRYLSGVADLLKHEIPSTKIYDKYDINGVVYTLNPNISDMTTSQYCDFRKYASEDMSVNNFNQILSVFLIPEGHEYNDGYNINKTKTDIDQHMSIVDANSIALFFYKEQARFLKYLSRYFKWRMKKMKKMTKEEREMLDQLTDNLEVLSGIYSL